MIEQEDEQTLVKLGLTGSQAKVYLALVTLGKANARTLWKSSKVARQDIYRILTELQGIGLLEKIIGTPTEFKAVPIEDAVSILVERKTKEVLNLHKNANRLVQKFKEKCLKMIPDEEKSQYILIPEREPLTLRLKKAIENTQRTVDTVTSLEACAKALFVFAEELKKALRKGVKVRWIVDKPKDINSCPDFPSAQVLIKNPNFKLRTVPNLPNVRLGIYDKREACMALFPKLAGLESPALWSNNTSFVEIVDNFFETTWKTAEEYKFKG